jgi:outer membrane protein assembly factor BamD (BamD/ComL family)
VESRFFLEGLIQTKADSACQIYEQLLDCYPRGRYTDEALIRLGQYDFILGDYRQSLDRLDQLIRNFPDSPNLQKAQYWMGLCYSALDEPDSAVTHYQTAARDFPNSDVTPLAQAELKSTQNRETSGEDDYIVQVGAFGDKSNAAFVRNRLKREGILTVMQTKTVDGRKLFVVTAGKPATKREAEALAERLNKKFGWDARVVAGP